jgi:hypothetical protein
MSEIIPNFIVVANQPAQEVGDTVIDFIPTAIAFTVIPTIVVV